LPGGANDAGGGGASAPGLVAAAASLSQRDLLEFVSQEALEAPLRTRKVSGYEWPATNLTALLGFADVPPAGMDAQVWRDFRPWRTRGFTMRDIIHTRARKTVLLHEKTEFSHEIFTTVVKDGVPYYLTSEMKTLAHYKVARLLKLLDFILQVRRARRGRGLGVACAARARAGTIESDDLSCSRRPRSSPTHLNAPTPHLPPTLPPQPVPCSCTAWARSTRCRTCTSCGRCCPTRCCARATCATCCTRRPAWRPCSRCARRTTTWT
jgi:hypothetical protein